MFDRFVPEAREVLSRSRDEAHRLGHDFIAPAHVLLAVFEIDGTAPARALGNLGVDREAVRTRILEAVPRKPAAKGGGMLPFTPGAKAMLEAALEEATDLRHDHIGVGHLFLGALRADDAKFLGDPVAKAFREAGLKPDEVRAEVLRLLGARDG